MNVLKGVRSVKAQFVCFATLAIICRTENVPLFIQIQLLDVKNIFHKTHVNYAKRDT